MANVFDSLMDAEDVALELDWNVDTVNREARNGRIPSKKIGASFVFHRTVIRLYKDALMKTMGNRDKAMNMVMEDLANESALIT